jgi:hypothetical protein
VRLSLQRRDSASDEKLDSRQDAGGLGVAQRQARTRIDVLEDELRAAGMQPDAAENFAHRLVIEHPFTARFGVHTLIEEIQASGVDRATAPLCAATLISIELLGQGRDFGNVRRELDTLGLEPDTAMAGVLDGSRVFREIKALHSDAQLGQSYASAGLLLAASVLTVLLAGLFLDFPL